jgi:hypothetical protein
VVREGLRSLTTRNVWRLVREIASLQLRRKTNMKKILICLVLVVLFLGVVDAQTKSITGKVVDVNSGASGRFEVATIIVGGTRYSFYTFSANGEKAYNPKVIGEVGIGKTVRVYYSQIVRERDGYELTATKVVEIRKPKSKSK